MYTKVRLEKLWVKVSSQDDAALPGVAASLDELRLPYKMWLLNCLRLLNGYVMSYSKYPAKSTWKVEFEGKLQQTCPNGLINMFLLTKIMQTQ